MKIKLKTDGDKVKATYSTNAPGIDKKKTQIQGGKSQTVKSKTVVLPANAKEGSFNLESKKMQPIKKLKGKFAKKGYDMPTGVHTQSELKKEYGSGLARKAIKAGEKTNRVKESEKTVMVGVKTKNYQSALKKKK